MPNLVIGPEKLNIHYQLHGPQDKATIVLLHGFCGSIKYWEDVIPLLSTDFQVLVPDFRGHGQSGMIDGPWRIEDMAKDIVLLLDELGIEKCIVYGHSMGGYVTLALAELYPARLSGWGLVHSTSLPDSPEAKENREKTIARIHHSGIEPLVNELVPKLFAPEHLHSMASEVERMKLVGYGTNPKGAALATAAMKDRPDRSHVIKQARVPVVLIAGEQDQVIPPDRVHTATGEHISTHTITDCGHMGMIEAPDSISQLLLKHVEQIVR